MERRRASWPLLLGVASAFALVALLGANWYHVDYPVTDDSLTASGWLSLHGADVSLALLASFAGLAMLIGGREALIAALLAAVAAVVIVAYHIIDPPGDSEFLDVSLEIGIWLSLVAALGLAAAAVALGSGQWITRPRTSR
jgi:hypothetical protein